MCWKYAFITVLFICTIATGFEPDIYKYVCEDVANKLSSEKNEENSTIEKCSIENIPEQELELNNSDNLRVILNLPRLQCKYEIALVVNESIKNDEECRGHNFTSNSTIHTIDLLRIQTRNFVESRETSESCTDDDFLLDYEHIFSACYALRFSINGYTYVYRAKKHIKTNYTRTNIVEPNATCLFEESGNNSSDVAFDFEISLDSSSSMELETRNMSLKVENESDACRLHSCPVTNATWIIELRNPDPQSFLEKYCHKNLSGNQSYMKPLQCHVPLPVSFDSTYCMKVSLFDIRCTPDTIWSPPTTAVTSHNQCTWLLTCRRKVKYKRVEVRKVHSNKTNNHLLIPLVLGILTLLFMLTGVTLYIQRRRTNHEREYLNANLKDLRDPTHHGSDAIDTDDETMKNGREIENDEKKGIIILYARDSAPFMAFMAHFREILKIYCKCHIYDWYAASEWNDVATVGACEWIINLFKKQYRTIWIDTPGARSLLSTNSSDSRLNEEAINDFRDMAFGAVLDCAKRNILNTKLQYSSHFIVRLEGFDNSSSSEDPFSDLSPHARYLIPYHLSQLCSHLSSKKSENRSKALVTEEAQLRERLIQVKNNSS